jgi:hypothetical protein
MMAATDTITPTPVMMTAEDPMASFYIIRLTTATGNLIFQINRQGVVELGSGVRLDEIRKIRDLPDGLAILRTMRSMISTVIEEKDGGL